MPIADLVSAAPVAGSAAQRDKRRAPAALDARLARHGLTLTGPAAFAAILILAIALRWLAFSPFDVMHADEVVQYQERAHRMVYGWGLVPWETRYGVRNALIPQLLAAPMALASWLGGDRLDALLAARAIFALICLGVVPAAYVLGSVASRLHGLVAMLVAATWFETVVFDVAALSESIATAFAVAGTAALLRAKASRRAAMLAGFLFAIMTLLRLQYAAYAAPLCLLIVRADWKLWLRLLTGALPALALAAVSDLAAGTVPFAWIVKNVLMNIGDGRASSFGVSGPWEYVRYFFIRAFPAGYVVLGLALLSGPRYRPVLFSALFLVLVHSMIAHKEFRFIHLSIVMLTLLAALASVDLITDRLARSAASSKVRVLAIAGLGAAWLGLSAFASARSGGPADLRGGDGVVRLARSAADSPGICGVGISFNDRKHIGHVYMPDRTPLYAFSYETNVGAEPFEPDFLHAANAIVATGKGTPPPPYRRVACRPDSGMTACLYIRRGGCTVTPAGRHFEFQQFMRDRDW